MMSLALTPGLELAVDADLAGLGLALQQRLRGQDHLDLARPDAEGQRPEGAVRGGVGVAADDGHARLRQAQLRPDDVDDALRVAALAVERDAELAAVLPIWAQLLAGQLVEDRQATGPAWGSNGPPWRRSGPGGGPWRPRSRRPVNAWGLVTSWTRCRSIARMAGAPGSGRPTCWSQIFSTRVRGVLMPDAALLRSFGS